jgi:hypothetical protein
MAWQLRKVNNNPSIFEEFAIWEPHSILNFSLLQYLWRGSFGQKANCAAPSGEWQGALYLRRQMRGFS